MSPLGPWRDHPNAFRRLLRPLAAGFRLAVTARAAAYRRGWLATRRLNHPVISIGNLSVGGTGKTPLVAWVAQRLLERGWKPCILTRGYGRRGGRMIVLDSQARPAATPCHLDAGDEPGLLARALPPVPIVVSADRYRAGCVAEERFSVDVHLLDDGFQHLALARDLDVVLLDTTQEFSDRALLPAGLFREPPAALDRAEAVVLTRVELADPSPLEGLVRKINPNVKIFHSQTSLRGLVDLASGRRLEIDELKGQRVFAFCGIGNPRAFFQNLKQWGLDVAGELAFSDHHVYSEADLNCLRGLARQASAAALATTEKDSVNLRPEGGTPVPDRRYSQPSPDIPIVVCVIETPVREAQAFDDLLSERLEGVRTEA